MPSQPEVAEKGLLALEPISQQDVSGLHVPVDEASLVCRVERLRDLRDEIESPFRVESPFSSAVSQSEPSTYSIAR